MFADVIYIPCAGIEEGSWWWWAKGCFLYQSETVLAVVVLMSVAALVAGTVWSLRQRAVQA
jgi:hypothetical protein